MYVVAYEGLRVLRTLEAKDPSQMSFFLSTLGSCS